MWSQFMKLQAVLFIRLNNTESFKFGDEKYDGFNNSVPVLQKDHSNCHALSGE